MDDVMEYRQGKSIRSAKRLREVLDSGGSVFYTRDFGYSHLVYSADEYGQYGFMDVMRSMSEGSVFEAIETK